MINPQKIVVISGGAAGIGLACPGTFLAENAPEAICDADPEVVAKFKQRHPGTFTRTADVTCYVSGISMKTWVSAQDIAASAVFLASDAGSKIPAQILSVDGNTETLAPTSYKEAL